MNKLNAKQLVRLNGTVTNRKTVPVNEKQIQKLQLIAQKPYVRDDRFFFIYKTTVEKAAKLGCELFQEKPFDKGNGETAILSILTLLDINGFKLVNYQDGLAELADCIRNNNDCAAAEWIRTHLDSSVILKQTPPVFVDDNLS